MFFYGKNHATGYPYVIKIMRQGTIIDKKIIRRISCGRALFRVLLKQRMMYAFGKIFIRQGILLGHFLCDRVQSVEKFATHPRHFPSQVPPPRELSRLGAVKPLRLLH